MGGQKAEGLPAAVLQAFRQVPKSGPAPCPLGIRDFRLGQAAGQGGGQQGEQQIDALSPDISQRRRCPGAQGGERLRTAPQCIL